MNTERNMEHLAGEARLQQQVSATSKRLENSLQSHRVLNKAIQTAQGLMDYGQINRALTGIVLSQARMGDAETAMANVPLLTTNKNKSNAYAQIASIQAERGEDTKAALEAALKAAKAMRTGPSGTKEKMYQDKADAYIAIANVQMGLGLLTEATQTVQLIDDSLEYKKESLLQQIEEVKAGGTPPKLNTPEQSKEKDITPTDDLQAELEAAKAITDPKEKSDALVRLGVMQAQIGEDPSTTFESALDSARNIRDDYQRAQAWIDIATAQGTAGRVEQALATAEQLGGSYKVEALTNIGTTLGSNGLTAKEIRELPQPVIDTIVTKSNNHTVLEALGYFDKVDVNSLHPTVHSHTRVSLLTGVSERTKEQEYLAEARKLAVESDDIVATKAFAEGVIASQDYETASNYLLGILDQISKRDDSEAVSQTMRILKGLIQIDNPKGKTMATRLFADENLPPHYRAYIAKKLFQSEYWDPALGKYLQTGQAPPQLRSEPQTAEERLLRLIYGEDYEPDKKEVEETLEEFRPNPPEQAKVLTALITNFGLTPDLPSYQLLEKPGVLKSETLEERVVELKQRMSEFEGKSRDELLSIFRRDFDTLKIFYVTKSGVYRYSIVNDYSLEKFQTVTRRVGELKVHEPTLTRFQQALERSGLTPVDATKAVEDAKAGKPLISGESRAVRFSTTVEYGSQYEVALQRLQEVWKGELKSLLLARAAGQSPETVTESLEILENHDQIAQLMPRLFRMVKPLKLDQEKISPADIEAIAKDLKNRLQQVYRGNREALGRLREYSDSEVVYEYLKDTLPSSAATSEWFGHLRDTLSEIASARSRVGAKTADKQLELTFLDKNEDFIRALRFADAAQCCFNASRENFRYRTYEYVTRLNKDPLSFMMDLKQVGSDEIQGFVFGRMGVNPETGKLVLMLNGIYSQLKGQTIVDNILRIIEEQMGSRLHPDSIVIASQGGAIPQPKGYSRVPYQGLEAMRALQDNNGRPEKKTYDDIGQVANGRFNFRGYGKTLAS